MGFLVAVSDLNPMITAADLGEVNMNRDCAVSETELELDCGVHGDGLISSPEPEGEYGGGPISSPELEVEPGMDGGRMSAPELEPGVVGGGTISEPELNSIATRGGPISAPELQLLWQLNEKLQRSIAELESMRPIHRNTSIPNLQNSLPLYTNSTQQFRRYDIFTGQLQTESVTIHVNNPATPPAPVLEDRNREWDLQLKIVFCILTLALTLTAHTPHSKPIQYITPSLNALTVSSGSILCFKIVRAVKTARDGEPPTMTRWAWKSILFMAVCFLASFYISMLDKVKSMNE